MQDLKLILKIDIKPFKESLKTALDMGNLFGKQINQVLAGKIKADTTGFDSKMKELNLKIKSYENNEISNKIKLEDNASNIINKVTKEAIESSKKQKSAYAEIRDGFSQIGFAIQGVKAVYQMLNGTLGDFLRLSGEQEKAEQKVEQAVKQTGKSAGFSASKLKIMARELQEITTFGDEDILNNVSAQLLTFTNITGEQFKEAQIAALNLSTVLDGDLKSASIQLGKALNDPISNLSALSRSGIQFTEEQKKLVKELWNAGKQAEAQNIILKELNHQYGGQAEAMAGTYSGALKQFNNSWGDLKETLGLGILPILSKMAKFLEPIVKNINGFIKSLSESSLTRTINELRSYGAAAKDILELEKFQMQQRLIEINKELEKTGDKYKNIKSIANYTKNIMGEQLELAKYKAVLEKNHRFSDEQIIDIWQAIGHTYDEAVQKRKEYDQSINAGIWTTANTAIINGIGKRQKELEKETKEILKQKKLLIEKEELNLKIKQTLPENPTNPTNLTNLTNSADSTDPVIEAFNNDMAILEAKKQRNVKVSDEILNLWKTHLVYLKSSYGEDSKEYQQAFTKKYLFERDLNLKKAQEKRKTDADERKATQAKHDYDRYILNLEDPEMARLERQKTAIKNFFDKKKDLLIKSGMDEQTITNAKNKALENLENTSMMNRMKMQAQGLGNLANTMKSFGKKGFEISKALNIAQVIMSTPAAAMAAYKSVVGIPIVGPALAPIAYAATIAQGALTIKKISKTKPPKAEKGGLSGIIAGKSHAEGGVLIEAEGNEYITNKKRVRELGVGFFDFLNFAPLESVKKVFSGLNIPSVRSIPTPSPILASGGSVSSGLAFNSMINEIQGLRNDVKKLKLTVHNHIAANDVINNADPTLINTKSKEGRWIKSTW